MPVIGISGPSCSGKSTVAFALSKRLHDSTVVQQDWFFRDSSQYPADANFCDLAHMRVDELVTACANLCDGRAAQVPIIDFRTFVQTGLRSVDPKRYTIIEGMTIFRIPGIWDLCSHRIYLRPKIGDIYARKRRRDSVERSKSPNIIEDQLTWIQTEYAADLVTFERSVTFLDGSEVNALVDQILVQVGDQGGAV
jgi:uridine kinase